MLIAYSEESAKDLQDIRSYSETRWGRLRATRYIEEIDVTIQRLGKEELHGKTADDLQAGLRKVLAGRHHIYFNIQSGVLHISRVLHGSMNVDNSFFS